MSYDCTYFKLKKLDSLKIPVEAFSLHKDDGWHPTQGVMDIQTSRRRFSIIDSYVEGFVQKDMTLAVQSILLSGEGSGSAWFNVWKPALERSIGELEAVMVWEGGETISKLHVLNGDITEENVEI